MEDRLQSLLRDRQLDREDFQIQIEEAQKSVLRGHYASAIAELRGAILVLQNMQKRVEG